MSYELRAIATVRCERTELIDDGWDAFESRLELAADIPSEALAGLESFSHVDVICVADRARDVPPDPWARHPRGNTEWPLVGIFAQRNKDRPNRLLLSTTEIVRVEERRVIVRGLDAVDGTPVLDIKPVFHWSGPRTAVRAPSWSDELGDTYF